MSDFQSLPIRGSLQSYFHHQSDARICCWAQPADSWPVMFGWSWEEFGLMIWFFCGNKRVSGDLLTISRLGDAFCGEFHTNPKRETIQEGTWTAHSAIVVSFKQTQAGFSKIVVACRRATARLRSTLPFKMPWRKHSWVLWMAWLRWGPRGPWDGQAVTFGFWNFERPPKSVFSLWILCQPLGCWDWNLQLQSPNGFLTQQSKLAQLYIQSLHVINL